MNFRVTKFLKFRPFLVGLVAFQLKNTSDELESDRKDGRLDYAVKLIKAFREEQQIPGIAVAISVNGRTVLKEGFGYQDLENKIEATEDMRANISSLTKLFTTHLFMKCVLKGRTRLNYDVRSYIPTLADQRIQGRAYPINLPLSLRWIFIHKAGLRHYDLRLELYDVKQYSSQQQVCRQLIENGNLPIFRLWPGEARFYSSIGFDLVGAIIERLITEENFYHLLTSELRMLNMNDTYLHRREDVSFNPSRGYTLYLESDPTNETEDLINSAYRDYSGKYASEGLVSTVGDLVKFGNLYFRIEQNLTGGRPLPAFMVGGRRKQYLTSAFHGGSDVGSSSYLLLTTLKSEDVLKKRKTEPFRSKKKRFARIERDLHIKPFHDAGQSSSATNNIPSTTEDQVYGIVVAIIGNQELNPVNDLAKLLVELFLEEMGDTSEDSLDEESDDESDE